MGEEKLTVRARGRRESIRGPRSRILLADDNSETRDVVRRVLMSRYEVDPVADGEAALEAIRRCPPDLILADATMPRMDGYALTRRLREDPVTARIPVVLLSARVGEDSRGEAVRAGADEYLEKPFNSRELLTCVRQLLERASSRRGPAERD